MTKVLNLKKNKISSKLKKFPTIILGSQKLRDKIKARTLAKIRRKKLQHKKRLVCEKCHKRFETWWDIREHWQSTGHKEPEECRWCRKKTYALQSHLCKEHWNLACMCSYCGQLFMFQESLEEHEKRHDGSEYRCYCCGKRHKTEDLLHRHILKHYVYERYGCNVCEKRFKKKKNVEKHLKWVHFICQYCGSTCESKEALLEHFKSHDDLKCVLCCKVFSQKNRLKYHYQMQHGHQDFYKCTLCFQRFPLKSKLLEHLKLKHKGYAKISCETCEMPFLYWSQYLHHFEKFHAEPQDKFNCSFCDFSTNRRCKLKWHVEKTSGDGFFCKICRIRPQCKTKFDEHMLTHEGKRPYGCDYCDKSYASSDILKHHFSLCHQEVIIGGNCRGHPCLIPGCTRYYTSRNSLTRHMRKNHMNEGDSCSSGQFCADNTVECRFPLVAEKNTSRCQMQAEVSSTTQPSSSQPIVSSMEKTTTEKSGYEEGVVEKTNEKRGYEEEVVEKTSEMNGYEGKIVEKTVKKRGYQEGFVERKTEKSGYEEGTLDESVSVVSSSRKRSYQSVKTNGAVNEDLVVSSTQSTVKDCESDLIEVDVYYCDICCKFWFAGDKQFRKHMTTHNKQVWDDECAECDEILESPEDAVRHYVQVHLKAEYTRY